MSEGKKTAWLLNDGRIGNLNQLKAIAYYLEKNLHSEIKNIEFDKNIILPNFINYHLNTGVKLANLKIAKSPDLIFSAGRKSALAASILKKYHSKAKIIQIMRPGLPAKLFDIIITPKHDNYPNADLEISLTPNFIDKETLAKARKDWPEFKKLKKPILTIIIGGDTKNNIVSNQTIEGLCDKILKFKKENKAEILITTSRRTSKQNQEIIKKKLAKSAKIFFWNKNTNKNPYLGMLAYADYLLITIDSISMLSDGISTGKAIYLWSNNFGDKKHRRFASHLLQDNLIKHSSELFKNSPKQNPQPPINETQKIADFIKKKIL